MRQLQHQLKVFKNRQTKTKATMAFLTIDSLGGLVDYDTKLIANEMNQKEYEHQLKELNKRIAQALAIPKSKECMKTECHFCNGTGTEMNHFPCTACKGEGYY